MKSNSSRPARLVSLERQRKALELRKAGLTLERIAEEVGDLLPQSAYRAVQAQLDRVGRETTDEYRMVQFERLNYMILKLWPRVQDGDEKAIMTVAGLMSQQDRLTGTEAPTQVQHQVTHDGAVLVIQGGEEEYIQQLEQMAQQAGAAPVKVEEVIDAQVIEDDPLELVAEVEEPEPPCPRYVRSSDEQRAAAFLCARCPHHKDDH